MSCVAIVYHLAQLPSSIYRFTILFVTMLANIQTCPLQQILVLVQDIYIYTYVVPWSISSDFIFPTIKNIPTQDTSYTNNRGFEATKKRGANTGYSFPWHHLSSSPGSPVPLTRQGTTSCTGGGPLISTDSSWPEKCGKFEKYTTYLVGS